MLHMKHWAPRAQRWRACRDPPPPPGPMHSICTAYKHSHALTPPAPAQYVVLTVDNFLMPKKFTYLPLGV